MLKTYQFKTHCKGDSHSSKTANIILPGLMITQRSTSLRLQAKYSRLFSLGEMSCFNQHNAVQWIWIPRHRLGQCRSGRQGGTATNQMDQRGTLDQEDPDMHKSGHRILPTQPHMGPVDFWGTCTVAL